MRARHGLLLASLLSLAWGWVRQEPAPGPAAALADAARVVLATMTPEQKARAQFPLADAARTDWHFTPRERPGVSLLDLNAEQRVAVGLLLRAALGDGGREHVGAVQELDTVLRQMAERRGQSAAIRDPLLYDLAIFGEPSASGPWALRFEGHHVSITVASDGQGGFSFSPCFLGASPLRIPEGPREGQRVLAAREDQARAFFLGLDATQRKAAHVADVALPELLLAPGAELRRLEPVGVVGRDLDEQQRRDLLGVIGQFLGDVHPELGGRALLAQAHEQIEEIYFAWLGASERGAAHGFRVQTPRLVIEWTTAQGDPQHVHAAWRDLERDVSRGWGLPQAEAR